MADIKAGDEVRILSRRTRLRIPEGGYRGTVVKVGRRYAEAVFEEPWTDPAGNAKHRERSVSFDMETGIEHAGYAGYFVRTPAQLERDERRRTAVFLLKNQGIEFGFGRERSLTLEQIEALAEVVKTWDTEA